MTNARIHSPDSLYARCLGPAWDMLHACVQSAHRTGRELHLRGTFSVRRGDNPVARVVAAMLRLPQANPAIGVQLSVQSVGDGERWIRRFGRRTMTTWQHACTCGMRERLGCIEFQFRLQVVEGALEYHQMDAALRVGPVSIPLPRLLQPRVDAREEPAENGGTRVSVAIHLPPAKLLIAYEGHVSPEPAK